MKGIVIVKGDIKKVYNVKGYIEMRIRKLFDKLTCQLVDDEHTTVVFQVRTNKKTFDELKNELNKLYPGSCVYLEPKAEES